MFSWPTGQSVRYVSGVVKWERFVRKPEDYLCGKKQFITNKTVQWALSANLNCIADIKGHIKLERLLRLE